MDEMTDAQVEHAMNALDADEREYLKLLIKRLIRCFFEDEYKAVIVFKDPHKEMTSVCTANCDEMTAADVLSQARSTLMFMSTADAPPKEKFN